MSVVNLDFSKVQLFAQFEGGNLYTINGGLILTKFIKVAVPIANESECGHILEEQIIKFVPKEDIPNLLLGN